MRLQQLYYQRYIIIDKLLSSHQSHKKGAYANIHNIIHPLSIKNHNTTKDNILTIISISPLLPFFIFIPKYISRLKVSYNKYYNRDRFNANIENLYGWGI